MDGTELQSQANRRTIPGYVDVAVVTLEPKAALPAMHEVKLPLTCDSGVASGLVVTCSTGLLQSIEQCSL